MSGSEREAIFIARSSAAEARVEELLRADHIDYSVALEATGQRDPGAVCYLAMVYKVARGDAERSRRLLTANGLGADVI